MSYEPEKYWTKRFERQGPAYVAKGGSIHSYNAQLRALSPWIESELPREGRVLDFGCGPGRFRKPLVEHGLEYEGIDLIPTLGTMDTEDVEADSFDVVFTAFVLQHIVFQSDYDAAVSLLRKALRPEGTLFVVDHEPRMSMALHMKPRGLEGLAAHGFTNPDVVGGWDGHFIAAFKGR